MDYDGDAISDSEWYAAEDTWEADTIDDIEEDDNGSM